MNVLNKNVLKAFNSKLRNVMYARELEGLKLTFNDDCPDDPYIYLELIKVKRKYRNLGYGSKVLQDIIQFAKEYNVRIELYAMNIYGTDSKVLYKFYRKNGFVLIKNNKDDKFVYKLKK